MAAKYKKRADGRYLIQVQKGIKPNGKPDYKNIYAYTIAELEQKAATFRQELERGIVVEDTGLTVGAWAEKWLDLYKAGVGYNTYEMYKSVIRAHIAPELGHFRLKDLKAHHIQELINKKAAAGLTERLSQIKLALGQMLDQAVKNEFIYKNVISSVVMPSIPKPKKRALTDVEQNYIHKADLDLKSKAIVYMLLYTGLRRGEALSLTTGDIDMKERTVTVNKNLIFKNNLGHISPNPKTSAGNRIIPIPKPLYDVLKEYLPTVKSIYLFPSNVGALMKETTFRSLWKKILNCLDTTAGGTTDGELKLIAIADDITPHIFRHTYATMLYFAGVDIKTAQYLLGHSSIQMTLGIYTHLSASNNIDTRYKLDSYFAGNVSQSKFSQLNKNKVINVEL